ncbi:MAG: SGNH/GDSL hydrolase family protein [Candidatus Omnitrophica bacterium]|nr:SGNH/GDSL hydrolase family protein [Candidatus Omnitrophota bacterium]
MLKKNIIKLLFLFATQLLLLWFLLATTTAQCIQVSWQMKIVIKLVLIFVNIFVLLAIFYSAVIKGQLKNVHLKNFLSLIFSLLFFFLLFESIFLFIPRSHRSGASLAAQRWSDYYWKPINQSGARDIPYSEDRFKNKQAIFVLGDSFTAGYGIKDPKDRFSDIIAKKLPESFSVFNFGNNGANSSTELAMLLNFPTKPKGIILQYFMNDIEEVCSGERKSVYKRPLYSDMSPFLRYFVKNSYFLDYIYWEFPHAEQNKYSASLYDCYKDGEVLKDHLNELSLLRLFAKDHKIDLIVIVVPFLNDIEGSKKYIDIVKSYFQFYKIPVVDVGELVKDLPLKKRIVNEHDPHASVLVHRMIADALFDIFLKL